MRLVLDTSVIVAAFRSSNGASNRLLELVSGQHLILLATPAILFEYEAVLLRPEQMRHHGYSRPYVQEFLAGLAERAEPVKIYYQWRPQLTDPDDEMVLDAALNGHADALITHNIRDFVPAASRFSLRILSPRDLLAEVVS